MKKIKSLVFEPSHWSEDYWIADTIFNSYYISRRNHSGYRDNIVYEISGLVGKPKRRVSFENAKKLAQQDWECRLSKIDQCWE